jgi:multiple sugar transport system ATP-binding protein
MADIVLDDVVKRYPDGFEAVKNLNLEIADGEFMILVGPSGCGKSTALNMIAGLEDISTGELRIGGEVVNQKAPRDRDIAMVFQSYALYPHMTVRENMAFALRIAKAPKEEVDRKVAEAAEILDLNEHLERKPANLSGGQRQRVAMGRAIVRNPKAFLMDEPLSNLDAKLRVQMRAEVARIQHRMNTTTVYVTHDQTEAMTLGDRVAVMLSGVLQQVGSPMELYNNPTNLFVAGFIGSPGMNFLPATMEDGVAHLPMVDVPLPQEALERIGRDRGRKLIAGIRPEDFEDAAKVDRDSRGRGTTFTAKLDLVEAMGAEFYAHFGVEAQQLRSADLQELRDDGPTAARRSSWPV